VVHAFGRSHQQIDGVRPAETIVLLDEVDQRDHPIWSAPADI